MVYYIRILLPFLALSLAFYLFFLLPRLVLVFRLVNVFTIVGLPPGLPAALLRRIADLFCAFVIRAALEAGTHLGYFPFFEVLRPQDLYPPPFFGREISTHFCLNHLVKPPFGFAITFSFFEELLLEVRGAVSSA